ncbi:MAG TPA: FecR domain-containing protein [Candidatus Acidoferrales bacterium]|nr:FecR domain-containing protein [Candidatus Acidoferrales bacterium]
MTDRQKNARVEVYWHTVRYRTVVLYTVVLATIALTSTYLVFPDASRSILRRISEMMGSRSGEVAAISARQARFVNLDGKVQVKKANSVQWTNAEFSMTLDKGDLIQTGPEGVARIAFADGTTYTVKGDTLVTVEENLVAHDRASEVGVHITSGQVDLATGKWEIPGSTAQVSFENAVASLRENSRAAVRSDPATNQQQITVTTGSAELNRGNEHVDIGQHERVSFVGTGGSMTKSQVLAPPQLDQPLNLAPLIVSDPKRDRIHFSWKAVPTARLYEFQASTSATFNHLVIDQKVDSPAADLSGFGSGEYFWRVRAIDANNNVSEPSDPFQFTLAAQGKEQQMFLEVSDTQLQGNVIEVIGRTEPGATLMINGDQVADIQSDGSFRYFTQPMQKGSHTLAITGQNRRGGTVIKRVEVMIP